LTASDSDTAPLRSKVEDALRQMIVSGLLKQGERIKERELVDRFGISRPMIREALRRIEAEGLITLEPNRGPSVARITFEQAEEIYEVRASLEAQACIGFALRASSRHVARLREVLAALTDATARADVAGVLSASDDFYDVILDGSGNQILREMLRQLQNRIVFLRRTSLSEPDRMPETLDELTRIVEALVARDEQAAAKASMHHVRQASRVALRALRRHGDNG
jgi:DNA-binding GntR family transcriptional regulator